MKPRLLAAFAVIALAGCQTSSPLPPPLPPPPQPQVSPAMPPSDEPLVWGRQDCKRATTNPEIVAAFSSDKGYCETDAGLKEGDSVTARMVSCMTDRGYSYRTKAEHDSYCANPGRRAASR